eukprot:c16068_g1_i2 orf=216-602(+)
MLDWVGDLQVCSWENCCSTSGYDGSTLSQLRFKGEFVFFHHQKVHVGFSGPLTQTDDIMSIWTKLKCLTGKLSCDISAMLSFLKQVSVDCNLVPVSPMAGCHSLVLQWDSVWERSQLAELCDIILSLR